MKTMNKDKLRQIFDFIDENTERKTDMAMSIARGDLVHFNTSGLHISRSKTIISINYHHTWFHLHDDQELNVHGSTWDIKTVAKEGTFRGLHTLIDNLKGSKNAR